MVFKTASLPTSFILIGMFGFAASLLYWKDVGPKWGFTFAVFCVILFLASLVSLRESVKVLHDDSKKKRSKL